MEIASMAVTIVTKKPFSALILHQYGTAFLVPLALPSLRSPPTSQIVPFHLLPISSCLLPAYFPRNSQWSSSLLSLSSALGNSIHAFDP